MKTDFESIEEEIKYLKEQRSYWKKYKPHGFISAIARMARLQNIEKRIRILTK